MEQPKLKPVIFVQGARRFYAQNTYAQNILLKAMSEGITSPTELKKLAGLHATADVFRTLDKMAIRREYHEALERNGISLDYIVNGIKNITIDGESDNVKLMGYNILLRSLGLERYEKVEDTGKNWEDTILSAVAKEEEAKQLGDGKAVEGQIAEYEVNKPCMPESEKKQREDETELAKMLYGE
jgi:hypothetical protein